MPCRKHDTRRGAVTPLVALLLIPLLAMLAFSIDAGWMVLTKTDLQHTADAAALAGAEKLQELYVEYNMPGQTALGVIKNKAVTTGADSPMVTAQTFASYNKAGNVSIIVPDSDIQFGFTDANGNYTSPYGGFPNTIQVTTRRDGVANGSLGLFFGGLLGTSTANLETTARATIYAGTVSSLQVITGVSAHILPVALDYKIWDQFYSTGKSPDGTIYTNRTNGWPELHVYPTPGNAPGSFGLIDVGPPSNYVPAFRNWIDDGETPNDISYLLNNGMLPVSLDAPQNWKCGPGLKSTLLEPFRSVMWEPNLIPLFKAVQYPSPDNNYTYIAAASQGQNAYYAVVGFVGINVSQAKENGGNMDISIQPSAVIDPTAVILNTLPVGTQTSPYTPSVGTPTTSTTFTSAKLTY